jgi:integrase
MVTNLHQLIIRHHLAMKSASVQKWRENIFSAKLEGGEKELAKGSVIKRSDIWYVVYRIHGKQKWEKAGLNKRDAEKLLSMRLDEVNKGTFQELKEIRFQEFSEKWLSDYAKISVKESTYVSYEVILRLHLIPHFGNYWMHGVNAGDIQNFIAKKMTGGNISPKTMNNILVPLKEMFRHAFVWGHIYKDPTQYIKKPRVESEEMDFLNADEIQIFLKNTEPEYYALFFTAVMTGMRRGELLGLKWEDIDWNSSQIVVKRALYRGKFVTPKSKHSCRRISMTPMLKATLDQHRVFCTRSETNLVFCNENGRPLDPENMVKRHFQPTLERAGLRRIRFHDLRHTFASLLIAMGENVKYVQNQLGHNSATTTLDRYGHLMPGDQNDTGNRLDQTVFGDFVSKLLAKQPKNPSSEGIYQKKNPQGC